ncbi:MAG: hypothetical protein JO290_02145 [Sphingomonadaceae bacterium]|nr:hypothetical protein [Sphingomonadaceae bacterium]
MSLLVTVPALAGVAGGLTIAAVGMVYRAAIGRGFWSLPNGIGGIALGPEAGATLGLGLPTVTGVGLHMVLSAIYGVVIVALAPSLRIGVVPTGFLVGVAVWLFNYYVVGRVHAGSKHLAELNPLWMAFLLHALFGVVTGLVAQALLR